MHEVSPQFLLEMPSKPRAGQRILTVVQGAPLFARAASFRETIADDTERKKKKM